jgi:hypothetical protein
MQRVLEEQQRLLSRITRNRKVLQLADARAKSKTICLLDELGEEEEVERKKNGGFTDGELAEASVNFSSFLGVEDGSGTVDWTRLDLPGDIPIEPVVLQEGGET